MRLDLLLVAIFLGHFSPVIAGDIDPEIRFELSNSEFVRSIIVIDPSKLSPTADTTDDAIVQVAAQLSEEIKERFHRIGDLPMIAGEIDTTTVDTLENTPGVDVRLSRLSAPLVSDTRVIVGLPAVPDQSSLNIDVSPISDNSNFAVAIIDTGFQTDHSFYKGRILREACFSMAEYSKFEVASLCPNGFEKQTTQGAASKCPPSMNRCDHGTHVAGIISGSQGSFNSNEVYGIAPEVPLILINVYTEIKDHAICLKHAGTAAPCILSFSDHQIEALEYVRSLAREHRIAAVNFSLGTNVVSEDACDKSEIQMPIENLLNVGILTVAAAGNNGKSILSSPACLNDTVAVSAIGKDGKLAESFPAPLTGGTNFSARTDFVAPGVEIMSSGLNGKFVTKTGTSMAAPVVAAAIAVIRKTLGPNHGIPTGNQAIAESALTILRDNSKPMDLDHPQAAKLSVHLGDALTKAAQVAEAESSLGIPAEVGINPTMNQIGAENALGGDMVFYGNKVYSDLEIEQFREFIKDHTGDETVTVTPKGTGDRLLFELTKPIDKSAIQNFSAKHFGGGGKVFERTLTPGF